MTDSKAEKDRAALDSWFKPLIDATVKEMLARKAVMDTAVEASPVWMLPYKILISKVWGISQKTKFIWTISGEAVVTDHIPGSMAATPRDAARHFSLKWQMDADRLIAVGKSKKPAEGQHMGSYVNKLIRDAESLYDLTEQANIWK